MKRTSFVVIASAAIACAFVASAETVGTHKSFLPQEIKWGPAPPALPGGAQAALLYGDPNTEGMFALRIKLPRGYTIPPHTHPKPEMLTVISGNFGLGMGSKADRSSLERLPAGGFSSMPSGMAHYVIVDEESVVQVNAMGPFAIEYVDPRDDPRLNVAPAK